MELKIIRNFPSYKISDTGMAGGSLALSVRD